MAWSAELVGIVCAVVLQLALLLERIHKRSSASSCRVAGHRCFDCANTTISLPGTRDGSVDSE